MKQVFSLLLTYVFLQTQTWAIGGGPEGSNGGGGGSITNLPGTYSGTLIPTNSDDNTTDGTDGTDGGTGSAASIGVFSVGIPEAGVATGVSVVFIDGVAYTGDMLAVADPARGTLNGVIDAVSNFDLITFIPAVDEDGNVTFTESRSKIFAQGNLQATISGGGGSSIGGSNGLGTTTPTSAGNIRLTGTASIDVFSELNADATPDVTQTVQFTVDGFKQSDISTTVTLDFGLTGP